MRCVVVLGLFAAGCHVIGQTDTLAPVKTERVVNPNGAMPRPPTLVLTEAGTLRFVEPLECPTEELVTNQVTHETELGPNLATFVVGVIATAAGGILTARGVTGDDSNGYTYGGIAGLAVGLPLAVGPWIGNRTEREPGATSAPVTRPGPMVACGARGFGASAAVLDVGGIEVYGAVYADGTFAVSPYALVDAFDPRKVASWDVSANVQTETGPVTITTVIDSGVLATRAPAYLATATGFDPTIEPVRSIPKLEPGVLRTSLTETPRGPAVRVVLPIKNTGGDEWGLRGHIVSNTKAIDGRVLYFGHIAHGATLSREIVIPVTPRAADALRGSTIEISIELRDAHGTAPDQPITYRGAVLVDLPRPIETP